MPDQLEHLLDALARVAAGGGEDPQVVAAGAPGVEARVLEHRADVGARVRRGRRRRSPSKRRGAGVEADQPEQHPDRRALAGAVRAEEAGDPARLDLEAEVRDGPDRAEALAESLDLDRGHRRNLAPGTSDLLQRPRLVGGLLSGLLGLDEVAGIVLGRLDLGPLLPLLVRDSGSRCQLLHDHPAGLALGGLPLDAIALLEALIARHRFASRSCRAVTGHRLLAGLLVVDDRPGVVGADHAAGLLLHLVGHLPRLADVLVGDLLELGDVAADVGALRVVALGVEGRVVDAAEVGLGVGPDRGDPLPVAVVVRLVAVDQVAHEVALAPAPVDAEVLGQERARRPAGRGCASSPRPGAGASRRRRAGSRSAPRTTPRRASRRSST